MSLIPRPLTRQEALYYVWLAALVLFGAALIGGVAWYAVPAPRVIHVGRARNFPPSDQPYPVRTGERWLWIVNQDGELIALEPRNHAGRTGCRVVWVPTNRRFEDPCCGGKFRLDGSLLMGPATRGLDRYAVLIRGDEVWIDVTRATPGPPPATPAARSTCTEVSEISAISHYLGERTLVHYARIVR